MHGHVNRSETKPSRHASVSGCALQAHEPPSVEHLPLGAAVSLGASQGGGRIRRERGRTHSRGIGAACRGRDAAQPMSM
eukprot:556019-Prymnesium_polylepis.2